MEEMDPMERTADGKQRAGRPEAARESTSSDVRQQAIHP